MTIEKRIMDAQSTIELDQEELKRDGERFRKLAAYAKTVPAGRCIMIAPAGGDAETIMNELRIIVDGMKF